ncbi:MAG TPA: NADH-quinone oxidoreductase subunit C [Bacteroidota bacterium]|nr:NADH-quinone oxidoreductase subunit C [Bacteroidota bacterium]
MTFPEIARKLQDAFGDAVVEVKSEGVPDPHVKIAPGRIHDIAAALHGDPDLRFDYLMCLSGVDHGRETLGVVYHLASMTHRHKLTLKTDLPAADPKIPTVSDLWPTANWHEREAWDMFGIKFENHPDLRRILLPEDYPGHPLRKDFKVPEFYNGMKVPY